jgi:hypothetical protein
VATFDRRPFSIVRLRHEVAFQCFRDEPARAIPLLPEELRRLY